MSKYNQNILQQLNNREKENALRELQINEHLIDFCSNDYLGLAREKDIHLLDEAVQQFGATGSRLLTGNYKLTQEVESYLASFYKAQSALLYNSGYNANIGLFSSLLKRNDTVIYDELIHASIRDGIRLSNAKSYSFKHNNLASLKEKLDLSKGLVYVVVESIYSMDGDAAPLKELVELCNLHQAALIVDEAHAVGVFDDGKGMVTALNLEEDVFARIVTFGKAYGCHGAAVLGNELLKQYLINFSRAFIYTTAMPLHNVLAIRKAHNFLQKNKDRLKQLVTLINYFKSLFNHTSISLIPSNSAIQCLVVPGNKKVKQLAENIQKEGFYVRAILSPTVPRGKERLRICLHSFNTTEQVNNLAKAINYYLQ